MTKSRPRTGDMALPDDPESLAEFESLLSYLKQSRGFDFTAYKRTSLMRRVLVRMQTMSGYTEQEVASKLLDESNGAAGFLQKPFLPEDLTRVLRDASQRAVR